MKLTKEDIQKLKAIEKPFMYLDEEYKLLLTKLSSNLMWIDYWGTWNINHDDNLTKGTTYRLRPDYPEPEEETSEPDIQTQIKNINKRLGDLEKNRGKLAKTEFKEVMAIISKLQKEVEALKNEN